MTRSCAYLWVAVAVAACGDDGGLPAGADGGVDAVTACGDELCAAIGASCGATIDPCGDTVSCGTCTFAPEEIAAPGRWPALGYGTGPVAVYVDTSEGWAIAVARRDGDGWSTEVITTLTGEPRGRPALAVAADGTPWIAYVDADGAVWVATPDVDAGWITEGPLGSGRAVAIALGPSGPVLAIGGVVAAASGVFVGERRAAGWELGRVGPAADGNAPRSVALAVGVDRIDVVWRDDVDDVIRHARGQGSAYTVDVVEPTANEPSDDGALSLAVGAGGRPHVLYGRGPTDLVYAVRDGDAWRSTLLTSASGDRDNALAIDALGGLHAAAFRDGGLAVADEHAGVWLTQIAADECVQGVLDLAADPAGGVHVVYSCGSAVRYLARAIP